jgi:hypothetical protein
VKTPFHRRPAARGCGRSRGARREALRLVACALIAALAPLVAADPPTVSAEMPWADNDGYTPVVVTAASPVERTLRLRARSGSGEASTEMRLPAGQTVRLSLLLPSCDEYYGQAQITWSSDDGATGDLTASAGNTYRRLGLAVIDADERIPLKGLEYADKTAFATQQHYGGTSTVSARVPRAALPERWQGYPDWMTLVLAAEDDRALTPEQRQAIATWASAGGAVVVADGAQREAWRQLGVEPLLLAEAEGAIVARLERIAAEAGSQPGLTPVPGTESVPATGFMLLAILFALVVGPLNLWWVRRRGQPALFLITTPLLSLVTCVVLLGASVLIDGLSLRRVVSQLTVLDQRHARAITWTRATYYGAFAVSRFAVDGEAEVLARGEEDNQDWRWRGRRRQAPEALTVDWHDGQHLAGEWIPARRNRQLLYAIPRPERSQLQLARSGDGWRITNGLAVGVRRLSWHDGAGGLHSCGAIPGGATAALSAGGFEVETDGSAFGPAAMHAAEVAGRPWGFAAELDGPLDGIPGPAGVDARPVTGIVVGQLTPGGAP